MSLLSWCKLTTARVTQSLLKPFTVQSRSAKFLPDQPTFPVPEYPEERHIYRWGYYDRYRRRGLLYHNDNQDRVNVLKKYRPSEPWREKSALFGQNDYIDILGNGELHPVNIMYKVPAWLRGFSGNEFQMLIRRRKFLSKTIYSDARPKKWHELNKRITFLYKFLNRKTRTPLIYRKK